MLSRVVIVFVIKSCFFLLSISYGNKDDAKNEVASQFKTFVEKYNKSYVQDTPEYLKRLVIFQESLERVKKLNKQRNHSNSAWYGITEFSDMTPNEFIMAVNKMKRSEKSSILRSYLYSSPKVIDFRNLKELPKHVDWRDKKVITAVKNQKKCGACWAFSTVETIETMYALKTGHLQEFSVQQIIDCAKGDNHGCDGGDTCGVLEWMAESKIHIVPESEYPLTDVTGKCKIKDPPKGVQLAHNYTCENFVNSEVTMLKLLKDHGPLVAAVDASTWQDYLGGIIQYHCETKRNHAVQIVGYDLTGNIPYYIVRNSWGSKFGLGGYLHIAVGKNLCGIALEVSTLDVL